MVARVSVCLSVSMIFCHIYQYEMIVLDLFLLVDFQM